MSNSTSNGFYRPPGPSAHDIWWANMWREIRERNETRARMQRRRTAIIEANREAARQRNAAKKK